MTKKTLLGMAEKAMAEMRKGTPAEMAGQKQWGNFLPEHLLSDRTLRRTIGMLLGIGPEDISDELVARTRATLAASTDAEIAQADAFCQDKDESVIG